mmetsp:Transcript_37547/g.87794  ORF Transcript_37547/g.87794 Transcript_37547/m.87794 type:complete len:253 (-) Transcript_37547:519-1277(-)
MCPRGGALPLLARRRPRNRVSLFVRAGTLRVLLARGAQLVSILLDRPPYDHPQARHAPSRRVLRRAQHVNSHEQRRECKHLPADGVGRLVLPILVHDGRGGDGAEREEDVVDGRHHRGVERVQRLVQIVHLHGNAPEHPEHEKVRLALMYLPRATQRELDGDSERPQRDDGERADERADEHVHPHEGLAVPRRYSVHEESGDGDDDGRVGDEERLRGEFPYLLDRGELLLLRGELDEQHAAPHTQHRADDAA